jgi:hypothetical protein
MLFIIIGLYVCLGLLFFIDWLFDYPYCPVGGSLPNGIERIEEWLLNKTSKSKYRYEVKPVLQNKYRWNIERNYLIQNGLSLQSEEIILLTYRKTIKEKKFSLYDSKMVKRK